MRRIAPLLACSVCCETSIRTRSAKQRRVYTRDTDSGLSHIGMGFVAMGLHRVTQCVKKKKCDWK